MGVRVSRPAQMLYDETRFEWDGVEQQEDDDGEDEDGSSGDEGAVQPKPKSTDEPPRSGHAAPAPVTATDGSASAAAAAEPEGAPEPAISEQEHQMVCGGGDCREGAARRCEGGGLGW